MNDTLTIFGTLLTLSFGLFSLYTYYFIKYPGKISFVKDEHFDLYKTLITNISDLKILYQDNPIDKNKHLLRGYLINTGNCDITKEMIEKYLLLKLKNNLKWISAKILYNSKDLIVEINSNKEELMFDFGLFRRNELVQFEALIDGDFKNKIKDNLTFEHRIANTRKIEIFEDIKIKYIFKYISILLLLYMSLNVYYIYSINSIKSNCFSTLGIASDKIIKSHKDSLNFRINLTSIPKELLPYEVRDSCRNIAIENSSIIKLVLGTQNSAIFELDNYLLYFHPIQKSVNKLRILFTLMIVTNIFTIYLLLVSYKLFQIYHIEKLIKRDKYLNSKLN